MNEPAIRVEEQIISLFPDRETIIYQGWVLKKMDRHLFVYPLYYEPSRGNIPDNIRKCEEISRQSGMDCVFRIVEHTNYYLCSLLTDNGYGLKKYGLIGEWNFTGNMGNLRMEGKQQGNLFLKNIRAGEEHEGYVMADADRIIGIKQQGLLFLPDGKMPCADIEDLVRFSIANRVTQILADIPEQDELPEEYGRAGFYKAYLYRCYHKEDMKFGSKLPNLPG